MVITSRASAAADAPANDDALKRAQSDTLDALAGSVIPFIESHRRDDGGYAWADQRHSHLTPTHAAIGCYHLLARAVPHADQAAEFVRTHHPHRRKKPERELHAFRFQQLQSLSWLGANLDVMSDDVLRWDRPAEYPERYERGGNPVLSQEVMILLAHDLLGVKAPEMAARFAAYLAPRRRANGSYNNTPAGDGDGHVANTLLALRAWQAIEHFGGEPNRSAREDREQLVAWVQDCQLASGGFTYQPAAQIGAVDDVFYTRAAIEALDLLDSRPRDVDRCVEYLAALAGGDGGFSDRPGWSTNPAATFYALSALDALARRLAADDDMAEELAAEDAADGDVPGAGAPRIARLIVERPKPARQPAQVVPRGLRVFTAQIEAHGQGSVIEAVEMARALGIHLWGAKNAQPEWLEQARNTAKARKVPVTFFVANEEYGSYMHVPGLGTYSHMSDIVAPAGVDFGRAIVGDRAPTWEEFRQERVATLEAAGGRLVWQFGENEELARVLLDDSVERKSGYAAISTFHFGNPDFTNSQPFLYRWRYRLPFVALQDAHGGEAWWFGDQLSGFRTLFLARRPTWDEWLTALANDWIVSVRHDAVSEYSTWVHGGADGVQDFVRGQESEWRWWGSKRDDIRRPWASVAVISPRDKFEAGRPEAGLAIRVRCRWDNTTQGLPKKQVSELVSLVVDGRRVDTERVEKRGRGRELTDVFDLYRWRGADEGRHSIVARIRHIATGEMKNVVASVDV